MMGTEEPPATTGHREGGFDGLVVKNRLLGFFRRG